MLFFEWKDQHFLQVCDKQGQKHWNTEVPKRLKELLFVL